MIFMKSSKTISALFIFIMSALAIVGCNSAQKQNEDTKDSEYEISAEMVEKQNELKQLASDEFSSINDKVRELNSRLEEEGAELSEHQKELLDEIQEMRVDANSRLNEVENVSEEEWEDFKASFENELESIQTKLDEVLGEF